MASGYSLVSMSWQMSNRMMSAPSSASLTAWLRPWPRAPPVTRTTLSCTRPINTVPFHSVRVTLLEHRDQPATVDLQRRTSR